MEIHEATSEEAKRAEAARSPASLLTDEQFSALKGQLVALLFDGPDKGTVIAHAPLNFENPSEPRNAVRTQVDTSPHKGRRYQLREILSETPPQS